MPRARTPRSPVTRGSVAPPLALVLLAVLLLPLAAALLPAQELDAGEGAAAGEDPGAGEEEPFAFAGRFVSRGELTVPPSMDGQLLYLASADRRLYAVEPGGEIRRRSDLGGRAVTPVALGRDNTAALVTDRRELILLDTLSGRVFRRVALEDEGGAAGDSRFPTLIADPEGVILVASAAGGITAYSGAGSKLWHRAGEGAFTAAPVVGPEGVLLTATEDRITALSRDGRLLWARRRSTPVVQIVPGRGVFHLLTQTGEVERYASDGTRLPSVQPALPEGEWTLQLDREGRFLATRGGGGVIQYDEGGREIWREPRALLATPITEGVLLTLPEGEAELRTSAGRLVWQLTSEGEVRRLEAVEGYIVVIFGDWVVSWYRRSSASGREGVEAHWIVPAGGGERSGVSPVARIESAPLATLPALYQELLRSPQRGDRLRLLDSIERRSAAGELAGLYRGFRELTIAVLLEPYRRREGRPGAVQNDFPDLRARAALLLGDWGDRRCEQALLELLRREENPEVLRTALLALSEIPYRAEGERSGSGRRRPSLVLELLDSWRGQSGFPGIAAAALEAVAAGRGEPGVSTREVYALLATAAAGEQTRRRARELMARDFDRRR